MLQEIINVLPPPAIVVFAGVLALVIGMKMTGKFLGTITSPEPAHATAQVAAMIVDSTVMKACTENLCESLDHMAEAIDENRKEVRELRHELRRYTDEAIRRR